MELRGLITNVPAEQAANDANRKGGRRYSYALIMSLAGLFSAFITICIAEVASTKNFPPQLLGIAFAVIITTCLWVSGASRRIFGGTLAIGLITAGYWAAFITAGAVELKLPWKTWSMGQQPSVSPISLFAGALVGSLLVLGAVFLSVPLRRRTRRFLWGCLLWPLLGGVLGVVGWILGPSLGVLIWSAMHGVGLGSSGGTKYSEAPHMYSLYAVWQTGMGFALGSLLDEFIQRSENR